MVDPERSEDWILANAPEFVEGMDLADAEIARGEHGVSLDVVLAEFDDTDDVDTR